VVVPVIPRIIFQVVPEMSYAFMYVKGSYKKGILYLSLILMMSAFVLSSCSSDPNSKRKKAIQVAQKWTKRHSDELTSGISALFLSHFYVNENDKKEVIYAISESVSKLKLDTKGRLPQTIRIREATLYAGGPFWWVKFRSNSSTKHYKLSYKLSVSADTGLFSRVDEALITQLELNGDVRENRVRIYDKRFTTRIFKTIDEAEKLIDEVKREYKKFRKLYENQ